MHKSKESDLLDHLNPGSGRMPRKAEMFNVLYEKCFRIDLKLGWHSIYLGGIDPNFYGSKYWYNRRASIPES